MQIILDSGAPGSYVHSFDESVKLLRAVGRGEVESTLRLYRPGRNMAFGRRDQFLKGFEDARSAAERAGYLPLVRPVGGHAAGYHSGCLVVDHFQADSDAVSGNMRRFEDFGELYRRVLESLGVKAGVGELPGEYCPGEHSVYASVGRGKKTKIVGTAQRVVSGAWWFSAGIVVDDGQGLRQVTEQVYEALGLNLDPETVGALTALEPEIRVEDVEDAVLEAYESVKFL